MDIEKTMQFILEHEAQHAVEIQELREQLRGLSSEVKALTGNVGTIAQVQIRQQDMISTLIEAMSQLADGHKTLQEEQRATRENLNALIRIMDELIRRDGRPPPA